LWVFEKFHSMSDQVNECEKCGCKVKKLLSAPVNLRKNNNFGKPKPGSLVKQYIEDVGEEVRREKEKLKTKEHGE